MPELDKNPSRAFLATDDVINWHEPIVRRAAEELAKDSSDSYQIAKRCYEFVRDEIRHSGDHCIDQPTCSAAEVLQHRAGWCFAKSHLLAALLRANGLPAGLCYQRLLINGEGSRFCLHGLNAVWLNDFGWYRIDPRGNKPGVDAAFSPPLERLTFTTHSDGECAYPEIWPTPHPAVIRCLSENKTCKSVIENLPDRQGTPFVDGFALSS